MKITELLNKDNILIGLNADSQSKCIDIMADRLLKSGAIKNKADFVKAIMEREKQYLYSA